MARPVRPPKVQVFAAPGVTIYHGIHRADAGNSVSVPADHAEELIARGHAEVPAANTDRRAES